MNDEHDFRTSKIESQPPSEQTEHIESPPAQSIALEVANTRKTKVQPLVEWIKSILSDLGLGFSWAVFYFTVFTSVWKGQTPGKRLTQIRVVKIDGSNLSYWESFGRYGGYGAGLATGLLGFLQIFWDANRQGIQDKIAETLVIDTKKQKKKSPEENEARG